jgi:hypothetical protein
MTILFLRHKLLKLNALKQFRASLARLAYILHTVCVTLELKKQIMNKKSLIAIVAAAGFAAVAHANSIDFSTTGNGDIGSSTHTYNQNGFAVTVYGYGPSGTVNIYSKQEGLGGENGIGLVNDANGQNEITAGSFIQIGLPTTPASIVNLLFGDSITAGETAKIYWSTTLGVLGSTLLGTLNGNGSFAVPSLPNGGVGFIGVTAGTGNVLLQSLDVTARQTPDGGTTMILLGSALSAASLIRRKLVA